MLAFAKGQAKKLLFPCGWGEVRRVEMMAAEAGMETSWYWSE